MKLNSISGHYQLLIGYQQNEQYRSAFNDLAQKIFGLPFEKWYQQGYWNKKYIPYTIFDGHRAIANASVNIMNFVIFSEARQYIQIGTVMTDEMYRNKNLSRFLIEKIIEDWQNKSHGIYLYANQSVLNFYQKFGFTRVKEYEYYKPIPNTITNTAFKKLSMQEACNRKKLYDYAQESKIFGKLSMKENADLVMFYCTTFLKEDVFYIESLDAIAIATFNENKLHLWDVFSKANISLEKIIDSLLNKTINELVLGFTPEDISGYQVREMVGDDVLFVEHDKIKLFNDNKVMFPLLSHA